MGKMTGFSAGHEGKIRNGNVFFLWLQKNSALGLWLLFAGLSFLHLSTQRVLWLDEEFVWKNLRNYQGVELFRVLDYGQAFPRVQLYFVQAFSRGWGYALWSLRLFSFVFMLLAVGIWLELYRRFAKDKWGALLAGFALVASFRMSYYAYELKPYASDVLVVALYTLFLTSFPRVLKKSFVIQMLAVTGLVVASLWSYISLLVIWMIPFQYGIFAIRERRFVPYALVSVLVTAVILTAFYYWDLRYTLGVQVLRDYWQSYFIDSGSVGAFLSTFGEGFKRLATWWYGADKFFSRAAVPLIPFFGYALFTKGLSAWKNDRGMLLHVSSIALVLFGELVIAGALQKYPFTGERVTLFYAPFVFYLTVEGIRAVRTPRWAIWILFGYLGIYLILALGGTFYQYLWHYRQDLSPVAQGADLKIDSGMAPVYNTVQIYS